MRNIDDEIRKLKYEACEDLRQLLTQGQYGNLQDYQIENFVISIMKIINISIFKNDKEEKE